MISILIVNWNTCDLLRACLASCREHAPDAEVILVDNASTDGSAGMVQAEFPEVRLLAETTNHGYAKGNNLAIAVASGDTLLTLNPDTELQPDTLDVTLRALHEQPKVGVVSCRFIGPDGETQRSVRGFPTLGGIALDLLRLPNRYRQSNFDYTRSQVCEQPMGTYLLFRREALPDPKKPFDESFPIFFNEVDLLRRMRNAGWLAYYCADTHIRHHGGMSTRQVRKAMIWESHRSLLRYCSKHTRGVARAFLPLWSVVIWVGAFVRARGFHAGFRP
ncbi:MAG: glycosyltransferase family 2 protein [Chthonomonas sp.]|nr:glycosyltransferase family 2 protein [Chthonomonas sp.]